MNARILLLAAITLAVSCRKKEKLPTPGNTAPQPDVQTEYRIVTVKADTTTIATYEYDEHNLAIIKNQYYYYKPFHGVGPLTLTIVPLHYQYDSLLRINNTAFDYKYDDRKLISIPSGTYDQGRVEYEYKDSNMLSMSREMDKNGKVMTTTTFKHDTNGNLAEKTTVLHYNENSTAADPVPIKYVDVYSNYDDAPNTRFAIPGPHNLDFAGGLSANNPGKINTTTYYSDGNMYYSENTYSYTYNAGNFPARVTINDTSIITYTYNK